MDMTMKIRTFFYTFGQGIRNLFRNLGYTLASVATITACLFLFGMFFSVLINFRHIMLQAEENVSVTVFFNEGVTEEDIQLLKIGIEEREEVASVTFTTADEAWEDFAQRFPEGFTEGFLENPLEGSDNLEIFLSDVSKQPELVSFLKNVDIVREVNYSEITANALSGANRLLTYASMIIIAILLIVSVFLINNTVATGIANHRDEIEIMKYVGATDFFVRAPYVFEGLLIGIIGSMVPLVLTYYIYNMAVEVISSRYSMLTGILQFLPVNDVFYYLVPISVILGVGIGFGGSMFTVKRHLKV